MDRGGKGHITLEDYSKKIGELPALKGVSHLIFKNLKDSKKDHMTFKDFLKVLLVTSVNDDI